jgi:hypothetical protein
MIVKMEINSFDDLYQMSWSYAKETLEHIDRAGLQDELMEHLEDVFCDYEPFSLVNDYLWHEFDEDKFIGEHKTLDDIEDLDELKGYCSYKAKMTIWDTTSKNKEELLWQYIQDNFSNNTLTEISDKLEDLDIEDLEEEE